jgi:cyclophilin family peptidyl-prolyl cis-trans isomerase
MKNAVFIVLALLFIAALVYFGTKSKGKKTMTPTSPTPSPLSVSAKPAAKQFSKAEQVIEAGKTYTITLKTTVGDIVIELDSKATPVTANNFVFLAQQGFYDNTIFHRTIKGFMIQGGDPKGTGTGGPGYQFKDEPVIKEYLRGTVAMANSGPDTNGSQFFIMHADYPLPKNYVIFGQVTSGLDVVDKIATAPVTQSMGGENSKPVSPVKINSVTVTTN